MKGNRSDGEGVLWVGADGTIWCDAGHPLFREAVLELHAFAELVRTPPKVHEYRVTEMSLWHACSLGRTARDVLGTLRRFSRQPVPYEVQLRVVETMGRWGGLVLLRRGRRLLLEAKTEVPPEVKQELERMARPLDGKRWRVSPGRRGELKQRLLVLGYPVLDRAGCADGKPLGIRLLAGEHGAWDLRPYQKEAVEAFFAERSHGGGVVVLPCGAGKTVVGLAIMARCAQHTLILTPNNTSAHQWRREILDKCDIDPEDVGLFTAEQKDLRPVTVTTYSMLTKKDRRGRMPHLLALSRRPWGLVIYDEVHLVPAPVFRLSASLQNCRRLGLTATLVREDGLEGDVFSLIGPKCFDLPWKAVEQGGWIAPARCFELRVPLDPKWRAQYEKAPPRQRWRLAATNPNKREVVRRLLEKHRNDPVLIIGHYREQIRELEKELGVLAVTGETPEPARERAYAAFRSGERRVLLLSRVANTAVDLPDARVAVELSGSFGSRQEEAQRLGRVLRPKADGREARFYALVSEDTEEVDFARRRQQFLVEQGYEYRVLAMGRGEGEIDGLP
ncbi:MAG: helicase-associated domain-containing protein [Alicyclobacillaceae bacterium]|nr:helicase-associated domain-containing protein [Alicyclobacillaceae bacterium]